MKKLLFFSLFGIIFIQSAFCQSANLDDYEKTKSQVQAVYIYNFTQYFIWPPEDNSKEFVIGVLGNPSIIDELNKMAAIRKVNGRPIKVQKFSKPSEIKPGCHILYIPNEQSDYLSDAMEKTKNSSTLIISSKDGLGKFGSTINFTADNGKPTFELNMDAVKKRNLKCAQQLKSIAILI